MSDLTPELKSKFERQPQGPPPPKKKQKKASPNAEIVAEMVADSTPKNAELSTESTDGTARTDGMASTDAQLEMPLGSDSAGENSEVQTVQPVHTDSTVQPEFVRKHIKKTFKFSPFEARMLEDLAYEYRMTQTDILRMAMLLAKSELEQVSKTKDKNEE